MLQHCPLKKKDILLQNHVLVLPLKCSYSELTVQGSAFFWQLSTFHPGFNLEPHVTSRVMSCWSPLIWNVPQPFFAFHFIGIWEECRPDLLWLVLYASLFDRIHLECMHFWKRRVFRNKRNLCYIYIYIYIYKAFSF